MILPGRTKSTGGPPWPGTRSVASAAEAFSLCADAAGIEVVSTSRTSEQGGTSNGLSPSAAVGRAIGQSAAGKRCTVSLAGYELADVQTAIDRSAGNHVPLVIRHHCRTGGETGYGAYFSVRNSGCFQLMAGDLQECLDLEIIARRIAEQSLVPGICGHDSLKGMREVFTVRIPDEAFAGEFLGQPDDTIPCPTPAQQLLFGEKRRRTPRLLDLDRPVGIGARLDESAGARSLAGQGVFFLDHVEEIARDAFAEFGRLTGRDYHGVEGYRVDDADYVILAYGVVCEALRQLVDAYRERGRKVGLVILRMLRPFPGPELCRMLQGKKAVTTLEHVQGSLADGAPLLGELRISLDRAVENAGADVSKQPNPRYPRFGRSTDRPALYSAVSVSTSRADEGDLIALIENMMPGGASVRSFQLGVSFGAPASRIPALERLSQLVDSAYSGLGKLGLRGRRAPRVADTGSAIHLHASADQNIGDIAGAVGYSLFELLGWSVACQSIRSGDENRFEPDGWTIRHSMGEDPAPSSSARASVVGVVQPYTLADDRVFDALQEVASVVVAGSATDPDLWTPLPARILRRLRGTGLVVRLVDAGSIAGSLAEDRWVRRQLTAHAVAGAVLASYPPLGAADSATLADAYGRSLRDRWQVDPELLDQCLQAFERGYQSVATVAVPAAHVPEGAGTEPPAPWTVREAPVHSESVYDAGRFWNSVGYLYESGQSDQALSDPYIATGTVPARTSAFRSWKSYRTELPSFLPENCTGCGACFTACPDAALPATVIDVGTLFESAVKDAERLGRPLLQLRRLQKHLISQAHRLVTGDERHEFRLAGDLFATAFDHLAAKLGQSEEELQPLREEMNIVVDVVKTFPVARTDTFFTEPEKETRGTGLLFTININADSCKACGTCTAICPDGAFEIAPQTDARIEQYRRDWKFASTLEIPARETIDRFVRTEKPDTLAFRLMDRRSYHSMVGGDSSFPGSGTQSTLHLISAVADAVVRPRVDRFVAALVEAAEGLEQKIKDHVRASVDINDFEAFGKRLNALSDRRLEPEILAGIAAGDVTIDRERLQHINDSLLALRSVIKSYEGADTGTGRTGMVGVFAQERSATNRGYYPYNPFSFPWINTRADSVAVAEGAFSAVTAVVLSALRTLRLARLILDDVYAPEEHDPQLHNLGWSDLTDEEWSICPPVCVIAGSDREAIPYLLRVEAPVKVFLLTGDLTASGAVSDVRLWPLARPDLFVLRSTLGIRGHLLAGLTEGLERRGPALFQLYVAEPSEHGYDPSRSVDRMREAVESRAFPVARYSPDSAAEWAHRWSLDGNPAQGQDWLTGTSSTSGPVTPAHWSAGEARFRRFLRHVPKNRWTDQMTPLDEFLQMGPEDREGHEPYIEVKHTDGRTVRLRVLPEIVDLVEKSLAEWRLLQEFAGVRSSVVAKVSEEAEVRLQQELARLRDQLETAFEQEASKTREQYGSEFHERLTEELLNMSGFGVDAAEASLRLSEYLGRLAHGPGGGADDDSSSTNGAGT